MKSKLLKIAISFLTVTIIYVIFSPDIFLEFGLVSPHSGLFFVLGLLFGPYGALGAVLADLIANIYVGAEPMEIIISAITSFGVSCLAWKLWYSGFKSEKITKPKLDNIYHLLLFLSSILICGLIYSAIFGNITGLIMSREYDQFIFVSYFLNFINIAFIFGILGIWLSRKIDFAYTPKISEKSVNKKLYRILFYLLLIVVIISSMTLIIDQGLNLAIIEIILIEILLFAYLTKPFKNNIEQNDKKTVIENIIRNFLIITLTIAIMGILISIFSYDYLTEIAYDNIYLLLIPSLIITDVIIILFFIPGIFILRYIENKVINPISSFSEIEGFIRENEKIEAEGLVNIYSEYVNENNEIGTLARSYTYLINYNNNYIENIHEIEGEKERIKAELDIATKIQAANLPTNAIENDDFIVNGYSHPAKEVGGDFFDYYMIDDDNLAIVIGDASGKGVPAALIAMITQVTIKEMMDHIQNPTEVLYRLNNKLCENNTEYMFLTLWLGIYNRTSKKLTFSNAGHNPPLIKENDKFRYLDINSGIVLGVMEDFDFVKEEIDLTDELILYTDGITDANNGDKKMYGEDRLLNFFNEFKNDKEPIQPLLNDIHNFTQNAEQYDDMTLVYLKRK
jgi:sigma-B regulation protein RsbU (phosphoserine phosphatase)